MATISAVSSSSPSSSQLVRKKPAYQAILGLLTAAALPLGVFGLANLGTEVFGLTPLFFAPFGLPGWAGAMLHLGMLPLVGAAGWLATRDGDTRLHMWTGALMAAIIAVPFITAPLDSLQMSAATVALFLLAIATARRLGAASPVAGWIMAPIIVWSCISATLGLTLAAAWTPPFALAQLVDNPTTATS